MPRSHTVIGTAGHIDHGKSSLILSLTGYNPDVLREEQEREMTIELGFAFYSDEVTFIDVPGHEKFLKTMLAGASSVDGAILVIAADDGIMPQTIEHFEILQLLGVKQGIIALTKIDLSDEDWRDLVIEEIRDLTKGTFLENAPILPLSNRTREGMDDFRTALDELIATAETRGDRGLFRMWIDRAFSIKGSGTIVAGTVLSGKVKTGDKVDILPSTIKARVKRIQVHKNDVDMSTIGERAALNLPGVNKDSVSRGDLLATPDHYRPSFMLNARMNLMSSASKPLETRTRLRLHLGSSEHIGRIIMLEKQPIEPGRSALVQFRLEDQAMADIGDRYVVRSFSEGRVLGGGVILETHPRKTKFVDAPELDRLHRLESAEPAEIIRQHLERVGEKTAEAVSIARELAFPSGDVIDILSALQRDNIVTVLIPDPKWQVVSSGCFNRLREGILSYLADYHQRNPHVKGARKSDLKARLMPDAAQIMIDKLLENLAGDDAIIIEGEYVWRFDHRISFSPKQEKLKTEIVDLYKERGFNPPDVNEIADKFGLKVNDLEPVLAGMCDLGELMKLHGPEGKPFYFHKDTIEDAKTILLKFFEDNDEMRFFEFREMLGSTRKFTTPLLMHFDDIGLTLRSGEVRKLREKGK